MSRTRFDQYRGGIPDQAFAGLRIRLPVHDQRDRRKYQKGLQAQQCTDAAYLYRIRQLYGRGEYGAYLQRGRTEDVERPGDLLYARFLLHHYAAGYLGHRRTFPDVADQ